MWKRLSAALLKHKNRLGFFAAGLTANYLVVWIFDYCLYPFFIWKLGLLRGALVMTLLGLMACLGAFVFYDWAKKDWFGLELLKAVRENVAPSRLARWSAWLMKKSDFLMLVVLSVKFDPFITTIYMRRGANQYRGMTRRDWGIFLASLAIGNIFWALIMFGGVTGLEHLYSLARRHLR
jgi:hypothetical protein